MHWLTVSCGRVHFVHRRGDEEQLVSYSLETGEEIWRRPHLLRHGARVGKLEAIGGLLFIFEGVTLLGERAIPRPFT